MIRGPKQSQAAIMAEQDGGKNRLGKAVGPLIQSLASGKRIVLGFQWMKDRE